jgi:hypothetical protein
MAEQSRERWSVYRQTRFRRERNDDVMRQHQLGTSGLTILRKIETGALLTLSGKPTRAAQYAIGNPRLPIQMIEQAKDTAFYAPLRLTLLAELGSSGDARSVAFMFLFLSM